MRDTRLVVGQVNTLEYVGHGTMVDPEGGPSARPVEVPQFSYATALQIPASRLDYETAAGRTVRVVKKDRAWNEEKPGINPSPSDNAAYRAQAIWLMPHAAVHAAAFAAAKKCLDGKSCEVPVQVLKEDGKTVFVTSVNGQSYKTTLGADNRPAKVEATIAMPGGGTKKVVASLFGLPQRPEPRSAGARQIPFRHLLAGPDRPRDRRHQGARHHRHRGLVESLRRLSRAGAAGQGDESQMTLCKPK